MAGTRLSVAEREEIAIGLALRERAADRGAAGAGAVDGVAGGGPQSVGAARYRAFPAHVVPRAGAAGRPRKLAAGTPVRAQVAGCCVSIARRGRSRAG